MDPAATAAGSISPDQIEMAVLLGDPHLNRFIIAISIGAVFFGANTYIGNGPNFMVKAIADQRRVRTPTFLGYIFRFTLPFMVPTVLLVWLLFFRG
ncbi:MAG TPA: sodium:proton antiporter [Verrucomicrobiota bacterium]|nr:sodium:proton antiporter [Verrucomicrobiota bacterium]